MTDIAATAFWTHDGHVSLQAPDDDREQHDAPRFRDNPVSSMFPQQAEAYS